MRILSQEEKPQKTFQSPCSSIQDMYMYIHFDAASTLLFPTEMLGAATCTSLLDERYRAHSDSVGDFVDACPKKRDCQ